MIYASSTGIFELHEFFSLTFPLQEYFFPYARTFFWATLNSLLSIFFYNFPLHEFFWYFAHPLPDNFSNGPSQTGVKWGKHTTGANSGGQTRKNSVRTPLCGCFGSAPAISRLVSFFSFLVRKFLA